MFSLSININVKSLFCIIFNSEQASWVLEIDTNFITVLMAQFSELETTLDLKRGNCIGLILNTCDKVKNMSCSSNIVELQGAVN